MSSKSNLYPYISPLKRINIIRLLYVFFILTDCLFSSLPIIFSLSNQPIIPDLPNHILALICFIIFFNIWLQLHCRLWSLARRHSPGPPPLQARLLGLTRNFYKLINKYIPIAELVGIRFSLGACIGLAVQGIVNRGNGINCVTGRMGPISAMLAVVTHYQLARNTKIILRRNSTEQHRQEQPMSSNGPTQSTISSPETLPRKDAR